METTEGRNFLFFDFYMNLIVVCRNWVGYKKAGKG
jgi:hypothetical protein